MKTFSCQLKRGTARILCAFLALGVVLGLLVTAAPAYASTNTLNPNGDGTVQLGTSSGTTHYTLVYDSDDNSYVMSNADTYNSDYFNLDDVSGTGSIVTIEVHYRGRVAAQDLQCAYTLLKLGSNTVDTSASPRTMSTSWTEYTDTYTSAQRPGGGTWSWTDINNLQVGIALRTARLNGSKAAYCSKIWVVVNSMNSYGEVAHTTVRTSFDSSYPVVYMYGHGFTTGTIYKVAYYDASSSNNLKYTDSNLTPSGGTISSSCDLRNYSTSTAGTWRAVTYTSAYTVPDTYTDGAGAVANNTIEVMTSAIPELSDVVAGIAIAGACAGVYWMMRKRQRVCRVC